MISLHIMIEKHTEMKKTMNGLFRVVSSLQIITPFPLQLWLANSGCRNNKHYSSMKSVVLFLNCIVFYGSNRYLSKRFSQPTSKQTLITQTLLFIWYLFIITILYRFANRKMRLSSKIPLQSTQNTVINSGHFRRHFFS